jgi:hypothetical protein
MKLVTFSHILHILSMLSDVLLKATAGSVWSVSDKKILQAGVCTSEAG